MAGKEKRCTLRRLSVAGMHSKVNIGVQQEYIRGGQDTSISIRVSMRTSLGK